MSIITASGLTEKKNGDEETTHTGLREQAQPPLLFRAFIKTAAKAVCLSLFQRREAKAFFFLNNRGGETAASKTPGSRG